MDDLCNYEIQIRGQVDAGDLNANSPLQITVIPGSDNTTRITASTDQSGLIGMIRHIHNLGLIILSVRNISAHIEPFYQTEQ